MFTSISAENAEGNVGNLGAGWPKGGLQFTACKPAATKQKRIRYAMFTITALSTRYRTQLHEARGNQVAFCWSFPGWVCGVSVATTELVLWDRIMKDIVDPASIANRKLSLSKVLLNFLYSHSRGVQKQNKKRYNSALPPNSHPLGYWRKALSLRFICFIQRYWCLQLNVTSFELLQRSCCGDCEWTFFLLPGEEHNSFLLYGGKWSLVSRVFYCFGLSTVMVVTNINTSD